MLSPCFFLRFSGKETFQIFLSLLFYVFFLSFHFKHTIYTTFNNSQKKRKSKQMKNIVCVVHRDLIVKSKRKIWIFWWKSVNGKIGIISGVSVFIFWKTVLVSSQINVWGNWFKAAINTNKWIFDRKNRKLETHSSKIEEISRLLSIMSDLPSSSLSSFRFSSKAINDFQTVKNEFSGKRLRLDVTSNDWSIYSDKKLDSYGENNVIETN